MSAIASALGDYERDLKYRLGKANGNVFHRREGIPGVHDGQVMVRLKSTRFIIIDYSIVPNEEDIRTSDALPSTTIYPGAGRTKCINDNCQKVGIPVLLHDSDPLQKPSLYVRSGLCFQCQRQLNETRRSERKRKRIAKNEPDNDHADADEQSIIYAIAPGRTICKVRTSSIPLRRDAVILNGTNLPLTKMTTRPNSTPQELATSLEQCTREALLATERLRSLDATSITSSHHHQFELEAAESLLHPHDPTSISNVHHSSSEHHATATEDALALYTKAFESLHQSIIILSHWKKAWDKVNPSIPAPPSDANGADPTLSDAVASAAAVVAAATTDNENGVVSLLMAADRRKEDEEAGLAGLEGFEV